MEFEDLRRQFSLLIGADVKISCSSKGSGKLSFSFKDTDDLRRIISLIQNN
jgi:hypothetical protein